MSKSFHKASWSLETDIMAQGLMSGESIRGSCPKCGGGESGEKSFVLSRDPGGWAYYICFRASCGYRGKIDALGSKIASDGPAKPVHRLHPFTRAVQGLDNSQVKWWRNKFGINPGSETYWCPSLARFAIRVYGPLGQHRGWALRDFEGGLVPKVLAYPERDEPFVGWMEAMQDVYLQKERNCCIVVEDLVSARKVADSGYDSVSLNGTNMNYEIAHEIAEHRRNVHLALDKGTMDLMLKYRDKFYFLFDQVKIWNLAEDLKYVPRERIRQAVEENKNNFAVVY